jgi:hypothetical protein
VVALPPTNFHTVPITQRELLPAPGYISRLSRLRVPVPGGRVSVLPRNDRALVAKLNLRASDSLAVRHQLGATAIPAKITVDNLFSQYLDLSGKVPPRLAAFAGIEVDRALPRR